MNTTAPSFSGVLGITSTATPVTAFPSLGAVSRRVARWLRSGLSASPAQRDLQVRSALLRLADSYEATQPSYSADLRAAATAEPGSPISRA